MARRMHQRCMGVYQAPLDSASVRAHQLLTLSELRPGAFVGSHPFAGILPMISSAQLLRVALAWLSYHKFPQLMCS